MPEQSFQTESERAGDPLKGDTKRYLGRGAVCGLITRQQVKPVDLTTAEPESGRGWPADPNRAQLLKLLSERSRTVKTATGENLRDYRVRPGSLRGRLASVVHTTRQQALTGPFSTQIVTPSVSMHTDAMNADAERFPAGDRGRVAQLRHEVASAQLGEVLETLGIRVVPADKIAAVRGLYNDAVARGSLHIAEAPKYNDGYPTDRMAPYRGITGPTVVRSENMDSSAAMDELVLPGGQGAEGVNLVISGPPLHGERVHDINNESVLSFRLAYDGPPQGVLPR